MESETSLRHKENLLRCTRRHSDSVVQKYYSST